MHSHRLLGGYAPRRLLRPFRAYARASRVPPGSPPGASPLGLAASPHQWFVKAHYVRVHTAITTVNTTIRASAPSKYRYPERGCGFWKSSARYPEGSVLRLEQARNAFEAGVVRCPAS